MKREDWAIVSQANVGTVSKATLGTLSERRGGTHDYGLFRMHRYYLELNRTEQRVRGRFANALYINPAHSLKVSVDVKHHVYLLTVHSRSELRSCV